MTEHIVLPESHYTKHRHLNESVLNYNSNKWALDRGRFCQEAMSNLSIIDKFLFQKFGDGAHVETNYDLIHQAIEFHALSTPDAIAAEYLEESLTYSELNKQANHLAYYLKMMGIKSGDNVGLFVQRSIPMVIGILAILKIGAAYVPQDIGIAPKQQLAYIVDHASINIVLTLSSSYDCLSASLPCSVIDIEHFVRRDKKFKVYPSNLSYLIREKSCTKYNACIVLFTSGTTGKPNGVVVTHSNICNILLTDPGSLDMQPGMKVSQLLNIAFDMAAWEILGCLSHGATLIIRDKDMQKTASKVDIIIATPSILSEINPNKCINTKVVAVAGEPCPVSLANAWANKCTFYNSCGPTETTIINTAQSYQTDQKLTIGKPTPNNTVYILDKNMQPCAIGKKGEMWAGGKCVSRGYLNNETLNRERYVADPFLGAGHIMFRTRDLGRWTENGELEHLGRVDDQVKIRGFRVELDGVSAALEKITHCKRAVTLKFDNRTLIAFVTASSIDEKQTKHELAEILPYYCIPQHVIAIEQLPITYRGKIDKRTLLNIAKGTISANNNLLHLAKRNRPGASA